GLPHGGDPPLAGVRRRELQPGRAGAPLRAPAAKSLQAQKGRRDGSQARGQGRHRTEISRRVRDAGRRGGSSRRKLRRKGGGAGEPISLLIRVGSSGIGAGIPSTSLRSQPIASL